MSDSNTTCLFVMLINFYESDMHRLISLILILKYNYENENESVLEFVNENS